MKSVAALPLGRLPLQAEESGARGKSPRPRSPDVELSTIVPGSDEDGQRPGPRHRGSPDWCRRARSRACETRPATPRCPGTPPLPRSPHPNQRRPSATEPHDLVLTSLLAFRKVPTEPRVRLRSLGFVLHRVVRAPHRILGLAAENQQLHQQLTLARARFRAVAPREVGPQRSGQAGDRVGWKFACRPVSIISTPWRSWVVPS